MDVVDDVVVNHVVDGLIPDVLKVWNSGAVFGGEAIDIPRLELGLDCLGSAVEVQNEQAVFFEGGSRGFKVPPETFPGLEDAVGEIECHGQIDRRGFGFEHVGTNQLDGSGLFAEIGEVVFDAPVQGRLVDIDSPRAVLRRAARPLAGERGGAAEVLAQRDGPATAFFSEDPRCEVRIVFYSLHGSFIEIVQVRKILLAVHFGGFFIAQGAADITGGSYLAFS